MYVPVNFDRGQKNSSVSQEKCPFPCSHHTVPVTTTPPPHTNVRAHMCTHTDTPTPTHPSHHWPC